MKKYILILVQVLLIVISGKISAQSVLDGVPILSPDGVYDIVYDRLGNQVALANLLIDSKHIGGVNTISTISSTCNAGAFKLYFEAGSIFDINPLAQSVLCQVYSDVSAFISSTLAPGSINIYCSNAANINNLGAASSYFVFPAAANNYTNNSLLDGQVYKYLVSGTDPYLGLPLSFVNSGLFYHGFVEASGDFHVITAATNSAIISPTYVLNPGGIVQTNSVFVVTPTATTQYTITETGTSTLTSSTYSTIASIWNFSVLSTNTNSAQYDFYTIMLHEAMHTLGIFSLIDFNGFPLYNNSNYYSRYDQFLCDHNNTPLLAHSGTLCPVPNYSFAPGFAGASASVVGVSIQTQTGTAVDITTCTTAAKYISPTTTLTLYTPDKYEKGSSLSHFEDMCSGTYTGTCIPTPTAPGYNNLYYAMANFSYPGPCYEKRYLKEEERKVLCDLGYTVQPVFGSTAVVGSAFNYSAGLCSPTLTIYGNNDGISGNVITYSTTGTSTTIPLSYILANDVPTTGLDVQCMEVVSGNGTVSVVGSNFIVNSSPGGGIVLLKYYPRHISSGTYGPATYVSLYFIPPGCVSCGIINNGGFEFSIPGQNACGFLSNTNAVQPKVDCWRVYGSNYTADLLTTICPSLSLELGVNTLYLSPPVNTVALGAATNTNALGLIYSATGSTGAVVNTLNSSMVNGQTYQISFWVINYQATAPINPQGNPVVLSLASSTLMLPTGFATPGFPNGLDALDSFTIAASKSWAQVTHTFVYNPTNPALQIVFGINVNLTQSPSTFSPSAGQYYCFLDEFSINPISGPILTIPPPTTCGPVTYTDLAQYVSPTTTGTFSGVGVTYNGQYNFTSPQGSSNYVISFTYSNSTLNCLNTLYHWVNGSSCCTSTSTPIFSATTVTANTLLSGPYRISSDFTVNSGVTFVLSSGEFIFTSNAKITIASGAILDIRGAHLYACGSNMWQGIVVQDGGVVFTYNYGGNDCLIEDAETAFDVTNYSVNTATNILNISNTTFNKNYIDINLANYPITSNVYGVPIKLDQCVFTCRDFTFSSTSWPSSSISDLRSVGSSTTGLSAPYLLQNASPVYLKSPHASDYSHIAINILNAGSTSTAFPATNIFTFTPINIGSASTSTAFVLFDAHETFINALNSNVKVSNCVFQNTQNSTGNNTSAIQYSNNATFHGILDLSATSVAVGCRFWDCHTAIKILYGISLKVENAIFRSSHSYTTVITAATGQRAIHLITNRIEDCIIQNNEFTNIGDEVLISIVNTQTGWINMPGFPFSIKRYLKNLTINTNTFSPYVNTAYTGFSTNYVTTGISLAGEGEIVTPAGGSGITIQDNLMYRVYNGISMNHVVFFYNNVLYAGSPKIISSNTITLEEDNVWNNAQVGIDYAENHIYPPLASAPANGRESIEANTISLANGTATNTNISLIHTFNGISSSTLHVPYVLCNNLTAAYQGFVFEGPNAYAYWRGNSMSGQKRGMTLMNAGFIGTQGGSGAPSDNVWNGSWTSANGTYVDVNSNANNSPLYIASCTGCTPPNSGGAAPSGLLYNSINGNLPSTSGAYVCGGSYSQRSDLVLPNVEDYDSAEMLYIAKILVYQYLLTNDSLRGTDPALQEFVDAMNGSNMDKFTQVEGDLADGDFDGAAGVLEGIVLDGSTTTVETNYYTFYTLYLKYVNASVDIPFTDADLTSLSSLAGLCPGTNGAPVYQARALYQLITGSAFNGPDACSDGEGERHAFQSPENTESKKTWDVSLYPNPNFGNFTIISKIEKELLEICITDVTGRQLFKKQIQTHENRCILETPLLNGIYFVSIKNQANERVVKKMVVAK